MSNLWALLRFIGHQRSGLFEGPTPSTGFVCVPPGFRYAGEPTRCRIVKNVPTLTKAVTPMENRSLTSSTCLVLR
jgi:hypothetical protein